ncbi:hypothetical protein [Streptomyces sp. NPDC088246]|uniref:hypothetical protein n=1 Tax=Streptomyces sp. NPDC088246 TaxID=3365842 RepID=UPI00381FEA45
MDGDLDMDAEHPGEDGCGEFGGEGEEGGGAVLSGLNPDLVETLTDPAITEGRPGQPPGKSQGTSSGLSILALPRRVTTSSRTRLASGAGRTIGKVPNVIATVSSLMWTSLTVRWLMVAIFCA